MVNNPFCVTILTRFSTSFLVFWNDFKSNLLNDLSATIDISFLYLLVKVSEIYLFTILLAKIDNSLYVIMKNMLTEFSVWLLHSMWQYCFYVLKIWCFMNLVAIIGHSL